jgi:molybdenum cofactor cytidylyltransferase
MGRLKQLAVVGDEKMVVRAVRTAWRGANGPVVVVTGADHAAVESVLAEWRAHISIVFNSAWERGQATSVAAALNALPHSVEAAIFAPVDQPFLDSLLLHRLRNAWQAGADLVAPAVEDEQRGAPALFDRRYWGELLALQGDVGGRRVLAAHGGEVATVAALAHWLRDVDTADELAALARELTDRESIVAK